MAEPTIVNQLSVETSRGFCEVRVVQGDISTASTDVVFLSCHANPNRHPHGATISATQERWGVHSPELSPVVTLPRGVSGTYLTKWHGDAPPFETMMVRLAGASWHDCDASAAEYFDSVVWTVFGSLAALELRGIRHETVAIPLIGGQRGYDREASIRSMLDYSVRWLQHARHGRTVSFVAFDSDDAAMWSMAMDDVLRRQLLPTAGDEVADALRAEVLELLRTPSIIESFDERGTIEPLRRALERADGGVCIQSVGSFARRFTEELVKMVLKECGQKPAFSLYENIEQRLRQTGRVAPWIVAHCHTLREFGNEAVHARDAPKYIPKALGRNDLLSLLSSLLRVLQFSLEWTSPGPAGAH